MAQMLVEHLNNWVDLGSIKALQIFTETNMFSMDSIGSPIRNYIRGLPETKINATFYWNAEAEKAIDIFDGNFKHFKTTLDNVYAQCSEEYDFEAIICSQKKSFLQDAIITELELCVQTAIVVTNSDFAGFVRLNRPAFDPSWADILNDKEVRNLFNGVSTPSAL